MVESKVKQEDYRNKGVYILPNLFTTASLFAGFYAIIQATQDNFGISAAAIFVAAILDSLDGRVARMTNTVSEFGKQFDSLADVVSFGLTPALVSYEWALYSMGKIGWLVAFLFVSCCALRLARFNTMVVEDKRFFQGMPCPAAAAFLAAFVWMLHSYGESGEQWNYIALIVTTMASLAMVSNIPYYSFKDINFKGKMPFLGLIILVLIFVLISYDPPNILFILFSIYMLSGPILKLPFFKDKVANVKSIPEALDLEEDKDPEH